MADPTPVDRSRIHPVSPAPIWERDRRPVILPTPLTSFVGREGEIATVVARIGQGGVRLVTLIGPGGVGKTRLAIAAATEAAASFSDGVWFVELAPIRDPDLVTAAVVDKLCVRESGDRSAADRTQDFFRDRKALLVLDNFEHLLDAGPSIVELLTACPTLTVLVTSRTVLHVSGENVLIVPPLSLTATSASQDSPFESEAVRLFVARAKEASPDFAASTTDASTIETICAHLEGLPLAIELAAARVRSLSVRALLDHLSRRLILLTGGPRDQPERLRSMRSAVAWSYELLSDGEQRLFRYLAVFSAGCTLEAITSVHGSQSTDDATALAILNDLSALVDASLVRQEVEPDGVARFAMLEVLREYAVERLQEVGEEGKAREAHAVWFLNLAEQAKPAWFAPTQNQWAKRLDSEHGNLRAALGWLWESGETDAALRLTGRLWPFWFVRTHLTDGRVWLDRAVAASAGTRSGDRAWVLNGAAALAIYQGDWQRGQICHEEALDIARELGDEAAVAHALIGLGAAAGRHGDMDRAAHWTEEALTFLRGLSDSIPSAGPMTSVVLTNLAGVALHRGDDERAGVFVDEALAIERTHGFDWGLADSLFIQATLAERRGKLGEAATLYGESLKLAFDHRDLQQILASLERLALLAVLARQDDVAVRLFGATARLAEQLGTPSDALTEADRDRAIATANVRLGHEAFASLWAEGRLLSLDATVAAASVVDMTQVTTAATATTSPITPILHRGITAREQDVLRLLVEGHSDREIAAALGIGRRTVETHVAGILNKLGFDSRTAVTAYAVRHGLV